MVITWSQRAREDLRLIHQYIAHDSKRYAKRVIQDITGNVTTLTDLPHLGRVVSEIGEENVREIGMYSYRIMYEVATNTIVIHGGIHKRRHFRPDDLPRQEP
ncbi:MAG: type II toxin-antitoxin system RelE/ParE family toxin [Gammaproteobacteria bacterium]|nr:type II toxin-antitoxin system RelE/ParE family toxin [Gammaproteobacteria bacterium]